MDSFSVTKSVPSSEESKLFRTWAGIDKRFLASKIRSYVPGKKGARFNLSNSNPFHPFGWDYITYSKEIMTSLPTNKNLKIIKLFAHARNQLEITRDKILNSTGIRQWITCRENRNDRRMRGAPLKAVAPMQNMIVSSIQLSKLNRGKV